MKHTIDIFRRSESGSIAVLAAIVTGTIAMTVAFTIDYSKAVNDRIAMQRAADAATLVAASSYHRNGDKAVALESAEAFFDNAASHVKGLTTDYAFDVEKQEEDGTIIARSNVTVTFDSVFNRGIMGETLRMELLSETIINNTPQDLYLALLVDSTASMNQLIDSVRDAARSLEKDVREKLTAKGLDFNRLFVKVAFFGDMRVDKDPYGWRESPLYDLSKEADTNAFRSFVADTPTYNGYDLPESSVAGIAHFLTAPIPAPLVPEKTVQAIVVWTDTAGLPLDDSRIVDDVTVNLYKRLGSIGQPPPRATTYWYRYLDGFWFNRRFPKYYYDEDAEYDGDATGTEAVPPSYGCCSTFEVFEKRWRNGGAVPLARRSLGLIVPTTVQPWNTMVDWPNVSLRNYAIPSANGIVDDVVETLGDNYSTLVVSR